MPEGRTRQVKIKRVDEGRRLVYGEVYAPNVLDTYGEYMLASDIEVMAHRFLRLDLNQVIDTNHNNVPNGSYPVESFIVREGDPDFIEGSWVIGVKVESVVIWDAVMRGELNAFSFEALVQPVDTEIEFLVMRDHVGVTSKQDESGHDHGFYVQVGKDGVVLGGWTEEVDGHKHQIIRGSVTAPAPDGHTHRVAL